MSDNAPLIVSLKSRIVSLRNEIERVRRQATSDGVPSAAVAPSPGTRGTAPSSGRDALTTVLSGFEEAQAELEIAQEYYRSALRYLEESRAEADRQQAYVAIVVGPNMAQESRYPQRILFIVFTVIVSGIVWGLTIMLVFSVRDHLM
jgi:capsular polysaccharide transport system permease protein